MYISICICTHQRPQLLDRLLTHLKNQVSNEIYQLKDVIVVDNDPAHSAKTVLQMHQHQWPCLKTHHLPIPNISEARNAALSLATGSHVAFIDDDEYPAPDWLFQLSLAMNTFKADVVLGPVLPVFCIETPQWLRDGPFFHRQRFQSGTLISHHDARTGNVLLKTSCLPQGANVFNRQFGQTGGEDTLFFKQLDHQHYKIIWCDEAPVWEDVPLERANSTWLIKRSYRLGQTHVRVTLHQQPWHIKFMLMVYLLMRSSIQLVISLCLALVYRVVSASKSFQWARTCAAQAGKITALFGMKYHEYQKSSSG
jgi:succinoglycan biosynthesis protein ExoM